MRRTYGTENKDDKRKSPAWLEGKNNHVQIQRKGTARPVRESGSDVDVRSEDRRRRRPAYGYGSDKEIRPSGSGSGSEGTDVKIEFKFTMQQLRDSLSDTILEALLYHKYNQHDIIILHKTKASSKFVEDLLLSKHEVQTTKKRVIVSTIPSAAYDKEYLEFKETGIATAEAVVAVYFKLYKKLFGEEDPTWAGNKIKPAVAMVRAFGSTNNDNYIEMISFVRKLLPLWKEQLKKGEAFPGYRPTLEGLFGKKRHFWANRNVYYKKWKIQNTL